MQDKILLGLLSLGGKDSKGYLLSEHGLGYHLPNKRGDTFTNSAIEKPPRSRQDPSPTG